VIPNLLPSTRPRRAKFAALQRSAAARRRLADQT
jgi:hypothetical protein